MAEAHSADSLQQLPAAPPRLVEGGQLVEGLWSGAIADARLAALGTPYTQGGFARRLVEKKWQYVFVADAEVMLSLAVIDCGYLSSGICALFDRGSRRLLINENPVLPPLLASVGDGAADASLRGPGIKASIAKNGDQIAVRASWAHAEIDLLLDCGKAPPPVSAVAQVGPVGRFDYTQKNTLMTASGEVRAGNVHFAIKDAPAGVDYTHGFLARETEWRWAFAAGPRVGFNLSEGFLQGQGENVVWLDGAPRAVGPVKFDYDARAPLSPWKIRGDNVDLVFQPEGLRQQTVDLKLILSQYVQPFGTFEGTILGERVSGLAGVTEDHAARW